GTAIGNRRPDLIVPVPLIDVAAVVFVPRAPDEPTADGGTVGNPLLAHLALAPCRDAKLLLPRVELPSQGDNVTCNVGAQHVIPSPLAESGPLDGGRMAKGPALGGLHSCMEE